MEKELKKMVEVGYWEMENEGEAKNFLESTLSLAQRKGNQEIVDLVVAAGAEFEVQGSIVGGGNYFDSISHLIVTKDGIVEPKKETKKKMKKKM